jgi:hypothetical protein
MGLEGLGEENGFFMVLVKIVVFFLDVGNFSGFLVGLMEGVILEDFEEGFINF